ncbi:MAG: hypothetical protein F4065_11240 [Rhodothermaceae bacterium]|nr:hypothetical protein [Rhodothermaceae bacterium]MXZ17222.1 hypothetical protein [Rhodothermaceae bacterium]MXZ57787.1 hypothetical protein [Rhodothermaceae bacterium]MYB91701.1 hypothetical protein [Rhodothermaceae bacterium]MYD67585.1 hypothetical protein [Rhodothermaceae bacterium]
MKYLLSLTAMCTFMFVGSVIPAQSQRATLTCERNGCTTTVNSTADAWDMTIVCGDDTYEYGGDGAWTGSLCGASIIFE